jgi:hypothetical protein
VHHVVQHLPWPYACIIWKKQGRIVAINSLEQNELLPILASIDHLLLLAAGPIVHPGLGLTHNDTMESWVQDPTLRARPEGILHTTMNIWVHLRAMIKRTSKIPQDE